VSTRREKRPGAFFRLAGPNFCRCRLRCPYKVRSSLSWKRLSLKVMSVCPLREVPAIERGRKKKKKGHRNGGKKGRKDLPVNRECPEATRSGSKVICPNRSSQILDRLREKNTTYYERERRWKGTLRSHGHESGSVAQERSYENSPLLVAKKTDRQSCCRRGEASRLRKKNFGNLDRKRKDINSLR